MNPEMKEMSPHFVVQFGCKLQRGMRCGKHSSSVIFFIFIFLMEIASKLPLFDS